MSLSLPTLPYYLPTLVPVPLQPTLYAGRGTGEAGAGGLPEKHEEPHGELQNVQTQETQEGPQPEEGLPLHLRLGWGGG